MPREVKELLTSLVNDLLDEGDAVWVEKDGERVSGTYTGHSIAGSTIEIEVEGTPYRVGESGLRYDDFGLEDSGESIYKIVQDYGLHGERLGEDTDDLLAQGYRDARDLSGKLDLEQKDRRKVKAGSP